MDKVENIKNLIDYCIEKFDRVPDSVLQATIQVTVAYIQADAPETASSPQAIGFAYTKEEVEE